MFYYELVVELKLDWKVKARIEEKVGPGIRMKMKGTEITRDVVGRQRYNSFRRTYSIYREVLKEIKKQKRL